MLVEPSSTWRGTDGAMFTSVEDFRKYLTTQVFTDWRPSNICLHNTAAPNLDQWNATVRNDDIFADARQRLLNLTGFYRDEKGWQGGPHLYITDQLIIVGNPLNKRGTHSTCFNGTHWGIEMVGDFNAEPFNPAIRELTIGAMGAMCSLRGLDPKAINFHKDCSADQHDCPGKNVTKQDIIAGILQAMSGGDTHAHVVNSTVPPAIVPATNAQDWRDPATRSPLIEELQTVLNKLGVTNPPLTPDGWAGKKTKAAVLALAALL